MTDTPLVRIGDGIDMPILGFGTWQLHGRTAYDARVGRAVSGTRYRLRGSVAGALAAAPFQRLGSGVASVAL
jgi:hypothetical protein